MKASTLRHELTQLRKHAVRIQHFIQPMMKEAGAVPGLFPSGYVHLTDEHGRVIEGFPVTGPASDTTGLEQALTNSRVIAEMLAQFPGYISSWECDKSDGKVHEGAIRLKNGMIASFVFGNFPPGGWNEAFVTVAVYDTVRLLKEGKKIMPRSLVLEIQKTSNNSWIKPLLEKAGIKL